jgi:hypothetical protein
VWDPIEVLLEASSEAVGDEKKFNEAKKISGKILSLLDRHCTGHEAAVVFLALYMVIRALVEAIVLGKKNINPLH